MWRSPAAASRSPRGGSNSIAIAGTETGSRPASRSADTSSSACSAARVTRTRRRPDRAASRPTDPAVARIRPPGSSSAASSRPSCSPAATGPRRRATIACPSAVRAGVAAEELELARRRCVARAPIGARQPPPDALEEGPLGFDRQAGRSIVDRCEPARASARRRWRTWTAMAPWPGAGGTISGSSRSAIRSPSPRRSSPAQASTSASVSPASSRRRRVSTLPWSRMDREVRPPGEQEAGPPRAVGPDARTRRQVGEPSRCRVGADDERVARIGPGQVRGDAETRILVGRNVLRAVDRDVDARRRAGLARSRRRRPPRPRPCPAPVDRLRSR